MTTPTTPQLDPNNGGALKIIRTVAGLSISELARRAQTSKTTISRFESGERVVGPALMDRIATAIGDALHAKDAA